MMAQVMGSEPLKCRTVGCQFWIKHSYVCIYRQGKQDTQLCFPAFNSCSYICLPILPKVVVTNPLLQIWFSAVSLPIHRLHYPIRGNSHEAGMYNNMAVDQFQAVPSPGLWLLACMQVGREVSTRPFARSPVPGVGNNINDVALMLPCDCLLHPSLGQT